MSITKRQMQILRTMRDENKELVYCKGVGYVGLSPVAPRTLFALLRAMAVTMDQFSEVGECERYTINETGLEILNTAGSGDAWGG